MVDKEPKMTKKTCSKCFEPIIKGQDYIKVTVFVKDKIVHEGFMHKKCNDKMTKQNQEALDNINNMATNIFDKLGILPTKKYSLV